MADVWLSFYQEVWSDGLLFEPPSFERQDLYTESFLEFSRNFGIPYLLLVDGFEVVPGLFSISKKNDQLVLLLADSCSGALCCRLGTGEVFLSAEDGLTSVCSSLENLFLLGTVVKRARQLILRDPQEQEYFSDIQIPLQEVRAIFDEFHQCIQDLEPEAECHDFWLSQVDYLLNE
jgi:hypothetical protein